MQLVSVATREKQPRLIFLVAAQLFLVVSLCVPSRPVEAESLGTPVDVSQHFQNLESTYFVPEKVQEFDVQSGAGFLQWNRYQRQVGMSFDKIDVGFARAESNEFPSSEYDRDPLLPFSVSFVSPRTVRLRFGTRGSLTEEGESLMLNGPVPQDRSWEAQEEKGAIIYRSTGGSVRITRDPWGIEFRGADGKLLTSTRTLHNLGTLSAPTPFCFVRRATDLGFSTAASFELAHDEQIFGCGESFTRLNKRGQKLVLYTRDAMGTQNQYLYKPIPFFLSSRGYGMFVHTSAPVTCDFGHDFDAANIISTGDEQLDIFVFFGSPKEILSEYTAVTGRSPVPPLWSFGLWMSRITYKSEAEVREVAAKLREHRIPCDVLHLDTGWFETDWQCDYKFSPSRFDDAEKMIADLKADGFHTSLWQLPYFTTKNRYFNEIVQQGLAVRNAGGSQPYLDAVLDFSNPSTVSWYQDKISSLLKLGVGAIKVDFGEEAPLEGVYASGRTGWYEHNLYPLRYNKTVADITAETTGEHIIWARSAWAGSQRYPLHWGGDSENTDSAMAATLRAGLSFGLSGFSFWSHDAGGFMSKPSADLYRRWLAFAVLTSHTRCHGAPPREPWEYGQEFEDDFRRIVELKYRLMPYVYTQARHCSEAGHPMLRTLFFEFPDDPTSWLIEDEYMFGSDLLVAPLFRSGSVRNVYLPPGDWVDYFSGQMFEGSKWHHITASQVPIVLLVRAGAVLPLIDLAQSTEKMDWTRLELRSFGTILTPAVVDVALPNGQSQQVQLVTRDGQTTISEVPVEGQVNWTLTESNE
jgi:alpha-D-xyloside xylohydrolase